MMIQKQKLFVFVLALAMGFGSLYNLAAQTTETAPATTTVETDLQDEIALVDEAAQLDSTGLFIKLSTQYQVELAVLQDLKAQGYTAGQIWLALEISFQSGKPLSDAISQVASMDTQGHGWGVLAQALGISPGSQEFNALKEKLQIRMQTMASELSAEHGNRVKTQAQNQNRVQTGDKQAGVPNAGNMKTGDDVEANDDAQGHGPNGAHSDTGAQNHGASGNGAVGNGPKR